MNHPSLSLSSVSSRQATNTTRNQFEELRAVPMSVVGSSNYQTNEFLAMTGRISSPMGRKSLDTTSYPHHTTTTKEGKGGSSSSSDLLSKFTKGSEELPEGEDDDTIDDEIARLEKQLRQLKEARLQSEQEEPPPKEETTAPQEEEEVSSKVVPSSQSFVETPASALVSETAGKGNTEATPKSPAPPAREHSTSSSSSTAASPRTTPKWRASRPTATRSGDVSNLRPGDFMGGGSWNKAPGFVPMVTEKRRPYRKKEERDLSLVSLVHGREEAPPRRRWTRPTLTPTRSLESSSLEPPTTPTKPQPPEAGSSSTTSHRVDTAPTSPQRSPSDSVTPTSTMSSLVPSSSSGTEQPTPTRASKAPTETTRQGTVEETTTPVSSSKPKTTPQGATNDDAHDEVPDTATTPTNSRGSVTAVERDRETTRKESPKATASRNPMMTSSSPTSSPLLANGATSYMSFPTGGTGQLVFTLNKNTDPDETNHKKAVSNTASSSSPRSKSRPRGVSRYASSDDAIPLRRQGSSRSSGSDDRWGDRLSNHSKSGRDQSPMPRRSSRDDVTPLSPAATAPPGPSSPTTPKRTTSLSGGPKYPKYSRHRASSSSGGPSSSPSSRSSPSKPVRSSSDEGSFRTSASGDSNNNKKKTRKKIKASKNDLKKLNQFLAQQEAMSDDMGTVETNAAHILDDGSATSTIEGPKQKRPSSTLRGGRRPSTGGPQTPSTTTRTSSSDAPAPTTDTGNDQEQVEDDEDANKPSWAVRKLRSTEKGQLLKKGSVDLAKPISAPRMPVRYGD